MDITEKIKSFEDACEALGLNPENLPVVDGLPEKDQKSIIAFYKLTIIIRALNEDWNPKWEYWDEAKYFNVFHVERNQPNIYASCSINIYTGTACGKRLTFKSMDLACYARKQFKELYIDYLFIGG
jgi:hypothetical protein